MRTSRFAMGGASHQRGSLCHADHPSLKRQAEAFSLAFVLLGGRRAANGFLDAVNQDLMCKPRQRAGTSVLGLVQVVRVLRRVALTPAYPAIRP